MIERWGIYDNEEWEAQGFVAIRARGSLSQSPTHGKQEMILGGVTVTYSAQCGELGFIGWRDEVVKLGHMYKSYIQNRQMQRGENRHSAENMAALGKVGNSKGGRRPNEYDKASNYFTRKAYE